MEVSKFWTPDPSLEHFLHDNLGDPGALEARQVVVIPGQDLVKFFLEVIV